MKNSTDNNPILNKTQKGFTLIELIVALGLLMMTALAGTTIGVQVMKTNKKAKAIDLALSLESQLIHLIGNPNQEGYTEEIKKFLRQEIGFQNLRVIQLIDSGFNYPLDDITKPAALFYFDENLKWLNPTSNLENEKIEKNQWHVRLRAAYQRKSINFNSANDLILRTGDKAVLQNFYFTLAYFIEINTTIGFFERFGKKTTPENDLKFDSNRDAIYPFPIEVSKFNASMDEDTHLGQCAEDPSLVISISSINLKTGQTNCVTKDKTCSMSSISYGYEIIPKPLGGFKIDMLCAPEQICGCDEHPGYGWSVKTIFPNKKYASKNTVCGKCIFTYPTTKAANPDTNYFANEVRSYICPMKHYSTTSAQCQRIISEVSAKKINLVTDENGLEKDICADSAIQPPSVGSGYGDFPAAIDTDGKAYCYQPPFGDNCFDYKFNVKIISGQCSLDSSLTGERDAKIR